MMRPKHLPKILSKTLSKTLALFSALIITTTLTTKTANAAGTYRIDPILKQAIEETAKIEVQEPPAAPALAPVEEKTVETVPVKELKLESVMAGKIKTSEGTASEVIILRDTFEAPKKPKPLKARSAGFHYGRLLLEPKLVLTETFNDNIFTTTNRKTNDFITKVEPSLIISLGKEDRHALKLGVKYEYVDYAQQNDEDQQNYNLYLRGHLGTEGTVTLPYEVSYIRAYESREDDITLQRSLEPLRTDALELAAGLKVDRGSWELKTMGRYIKHRFDNDRDANGNRVVRKDANRDITIAQAHIGYNFTPEHSLILGGSFGKRDYEYLNFQGGGFTGPERSSGTYDAYARWKRKSKSFMSDIKVGWAETDYEEDISINDVQDVVAKARIKWDATNATSFNAAYIRDIFEDTEVIQPIFRERTELGMDFQLGETFRLGLLGSYEDWDFQGIARSDEKYEGRALFDFFVNDLFVVGAEYKYTKRGSDLAGLDFERSIGMVRLATRI